MSAIVFVNFPVKDVSRATDFYEALGFKKNVAFSNEETAAMVWDETFWVMLLSHDFYGKFLKNKEIADTEKVSGALIAFSLESAAAVKEFGAIAEQKGGTVHHVEMGIPESVMYGLEVQDLDGNTLEPAWMQVD
ncbi:VOC family protein [uncultured Vagococcus sp.]|uniref:VOC family protein n=1 Tax=uncultured Vagococcus sp. TaxID=189676 RepID=UPI0028D08337|nr:VOC family protein [uncultured Vagococcus sp.]